ncbi:GntR family transcriptional regulator [candidate division KSB3 bacterium]|uniref:GntR family transcriptional regulator n=1 Tax=candidate division KSB3 bacterium TaxID=2044937 RepID=A0A2G6KBD8_9BACT|nr:MAG: GntR family transcriptional regulator [candidate division KSB3 bacterium]
MKIDSEKSEPKYRQLKHIITRYLAQEHYQPDQKIPSEAELMERFDVSRGTVRQTLAELVNEGVIYKKQGLGSFFSGQHEKSQQEQSGLIGVITPRMFNYIYPQILQGINDVVHQKHYNVVLSGSEGNSENEYPHLEQLLTRGIEGLIFEPAGSPKRFQDTRVFELIQSLSIPVVFMDWALDTPSVSYVSLDDVEGGFRATKYLIEQGHQRIAYIYMSNHVPGLLRNKGYKKALAMHDLSFDSLLIRSRPIFKWIQADCAYMLTKELLALGKKRPTAIFFFNDEAAIRGYAAIREAGLCIPDDISVMGFDDTQLATMAEVPMTSVVHPKYHIGKWAAEMLFDQLEAEGHTTPRQMILHPSIAIRDSVKTLL